GEIERNHRNILEIDISPHVELGPIRHREHAHALAGPNLGVGDMPKLRPLPLGIPVLRRVAEREDALFRPRLLLVAPRPAEGSIETVGGERLLERLGLHDVGIERAAMRYGRDAVLAALFVDMDEEVDPEPPRLPVAKSD